MEEAGIEVDLKGILSIEYNSCGRYEHDSKYLVRMRVVFYAEPTERHMNTLPKSLPDFESAGACWCSHEDIMNGLRLRGGEPKFWTSYLQNGGLMYPLELLKERTDS